MFYLRGLFICFYERFAEIGYSYSLHPFEKGYNTEVLRYLIGF